MTYRLGLYIIDIVRNRLWDVIIMTDRIIGLVPHFDRIYYGLEARKMGWYKEGPDGLAAFNYWLCRPQNEEYRVEVK